MFLVIIASGVAVYDGMGILCLYATSAEKQVYWCGGKT
jgi:hypothetical protein